MCKIRKDATIDDIINFIDDNIKKLDRVDTATILFHDYLICNDMTYEEFKNHLKKLGTFEFQNSENDFYDEEHSITWGDLKEVTKYEYDEYNNMLQICDIDVLINKLKNLKEKGNELC